MGGARRDTCSQEGLPDGEESAVVGTGSGVLVVIRSECHAACGLPILPRALGPHQAASSS